jgi:hypothetical protein
LPRSGTGGAPATGTAFVGGGVVGALFLEDTVADVAVVEATVVEVTVVEVTVVGGDVVPTEEAVVDRVRRAAGNSPVASWSGRRPTVRRAPAPAIKAASTAAASKRMTSRAVTTPPA